MYMTDNESFMISACKLAEVGIKRGGGPFGCVIIDKQSREIVGQGHNMVTINNNPTLHAEMVAITDACKNLSNYDLSNCALYTSCEPCPMCLAAIYWARIDTVYFGNTKEDAAYIGFDDRFIYEEIEKPIKDRTIQMTRICEDVATNAFIEWVGKDDKVHY